MFENKKNLLTYILLSIVPLLFLLVSLFVINDYGISWDEPIHFYRGQAYLHYFQTGEDTYKETRVGSMSYFSLNDLSAKYFIEGGDGGHPPLNDTLAALTNYVFYQKLHLLDDIPAYHLFNIVSALLAVVAVAIFGYMALGVVGGIASAIALATYPLFWGESHFNVKDPPETGFISMALLTFYLSLKKGSWRWLFVSSVFSGLALGTKFNAFFIPVILAPFLVVKYFPNIKKGVTTVIKDIKKIPKKYMLMAVFYPLVVGVIFFGSWPYLWGDPIGNFYKIFHYYKDIGTGSSYQPGFYVLGGFNAYPLYWIVVTTPPVVLVLSIVGFLVSLKKIFKERKYIYILWLSWLLVAIIRVTLPETSIYGGVRQIMEYIPAMALFAGLGFVFVSKALKANLINSLLLLALVFTPHLFTLAQIHPNENVYFNSLVGGLSGAVEKKIPYAGNSFGNAYWPLLKWMNENAAPNAKIALVQGTALNIPDIQLRPDISRWSDYWSGIDRKGEYLIELTHLNYRIAYPYAWDYIERFLIPVAEVKVDGVAIAKLWKNDLEHTKKDMQFSEVETKDFKVNAKSPDIYLTLPETKVVSHVLITYTENKECTKPVGNFYSSLDEKIWKTELEAVPDLQISEKDMVSSGKLVYYFPGREAKYIRLHITSINSCIFNNPKVKLFILK